MIRLALADAANNCARESATAVVTLRSGVQLEGRLDHKSNADIDTRQIKTKGGGWITFRIEEVAAVESKR